MSVKANSKLIGAFVVGAVVLLIAGLAIFSKGQFFSPVDKYVMYFDGTVAGLNVGSSVTFRGVRIGKVNSIQVFFNEQTMKAKIPVIIQIESKRIIDIYTEPRLPDEELYERLIDSGLRAKLEMESLVTGQLMVELDFYSDSPDERLNLVDDEYPEIPTIQSSFQEITSEIKKIPIHKLALKIQYMVEGISDLVRSPELMETITTLNTTMTDIQHLVQNANKQLGPTMTNVNKGTKEAVKVIRNIDGLVNNVKNLSNNTNGLVKDAQGLVNNADGLVTDTNGLVNNVDKRVGTLMKNFITASKTANATLKQAHETMKTIDSLASEDSPLRYEVMTSLRELTAAARSIRLMAEYLERNPDALIYGKGGNRGRR